MHSIILIPARLASARLPDKPLLDIGGAPMIVQVWRKAMEAKLGDVVVACDGAAIAEAMTKAGGRAIITDPDLPSGSDRIYAALQTIDPQKKYDVVINLQGDMPTIDPDIIGVAVKLLENPAVDIATLAAPITDESDAKDSAVVKVVLNTSAKHQAPGTAISFSRAATGAPPYYQHIGIYVYRRAALEKFVSLPPSPLERKEKLEQLRAMEAGMRIDVALVNKAPVGVDTPEGLETARRIMDNAMIDDKIK
jgi:3-deoxy-manno-octulosonate cytidylyltransferase (CMP-KDO synthetase)